MAVRIALIGVWLWGLACLVLPLPYAMLGMIVVAAMAVIHLIEFSFFLPTFRKASGSLMAHFAGTLAFGVFHLMAVRARSAAPSA